jgi:dTDP-4-dehydrorhamnose reductase
MVSDGSILLTGASGFVGGCIANHLASGNVLFTPSRHDLDITDAEEVSAYFRLHTPAVVIHAAAFTDNDAAEKERGNKNGMCYQVNVKGTENLSAASRETGAYMIYLSTGSVFTGDASHPGPFTEEDPVSGEKQLSWYALTKAVAEKTVPGSVIRMSRPAERPEIFDIPQQDPSEAPKIERDYIQKLVHMFDEHTLYPLFTDQQFPITYLDDVVIAVKRLMQTRETGIFHVVSTDLTTPYELAQYAIFRARHVRPELPATTFDEFIKKQKNPLRYAKYSAIDGKRTAARLKLPARTWREIVDCLYELRKAG